MSIDDFRIRPTGSSCSTLSLNRTDFYSFTVRHKTTSTPHFRAGLPDAAAMFARTTVCRCRTLTSGVLSLLSLSAIFTGVTCQDPLFRKLVVTRECRRTLALLGSRCTCLAQAPLLSTGQDTRTTFSLLPIATLHPATCTPKGLGSITSIGTINLRALNCSFMH